MLLLSQGEDLHLLPCCSLSCSAVMSPFRHPCFVIVLAARALIFNRSLDLSLRISCVHRRGIAVPGVVRVPTPAEPTDTMTATTGVGQSQEVTDNAAPASRPPARATPAAAAVAATPQAQPPRQKEAPWSAPRPWDPDAAEAEEDAPAGSAKPKGGKPPAKAQPAAKASKGKVQQHKATAGTAAAAADADGTAAGQRKEAAGKLKAAAGRSPSRKRAAEDTDDQENQDPGPEPGPARKRRAAGAMPELLPCSGLLCVLLGCRSSPVVHDRFSRGVAWLTRSGC